MTTAAIVLGKGVTAITAVRSLGRRGIPVYAIGPDQNDIVRYSRYASIVAQPAQISPDSLVSGMLEVAQGTDTPPVVFCASDKFLEMLSARREQLQHACRLMLPAPRAVDTVLNKSKFAAFCAEHNLPAPAYWSPATSEQFAQCLHEAVFPLVIKPVFAHGPDLEKFQRNERYAKVLVVKDRDELSACYRALQSIGARTLLQEYIPGTDRDHYSYISYRDARQRELCGVGVRKLRLTPIHNGAGTFIEIDNDPELVDIARRLLDALQYNGIVSVCCKRDSRTGNLVVHEVNGRIPMGHGASMLANVDLIHLAYRDAVGEAIVRRPRDAGKRKWLALERDADSARAYRRAEELSFFRWLWSLRKVRIIAEFSSDDLRPLGFVISRWWQRGCKRLFGNFGQDGTRQPEGESRRR